MYGVKNNFHRLGFRLFNKIFDFSFNIHFIFKACKTSGMTSEGDESDDKQVELSSLPHVINDSCGDEEDDEQKGRI